MPEQDKQEQQQEQQDQQQTSSHLAKQNQDDAGTAAGDAEDVARGEDRNALRGEDGEEAGEASAADRGAEPVQGAGGPETTTTIATPGEAGNPPA